MGLVLDVIKDSVKIGAFVVVVGIGSYYAGRWTKPTKLSDIEDYIHKNQTTALNTYILSRDYLKEKHPELYKKVESTKENLPSHKTNFYNKLEDKLKRAYHALTE